MSIVNVDDIFSNQETLYVLYFKEKNNKIRIENNQSINCKRESSLNPNKVKNKKIISYDLPKLESLKIQLEKSNLNYIKVYGENNCCSNVNKYDICITTIDKYIEETNEDSYANGFDDGYKKNNLIDRLESLKYCEKHISGLYDDDITSLTVR